MGRDAEELIKEFRVKVNGQTVKIGDCALPTDKITVDNKLIKPEKKIYLMMHKPLNCVTAVRDAKYKTVIDFIHIKERVFPVGRLDWDTTGLLLLTNDGDFSNNIIHPSKNINKTYEVHLKRPLSSEAATRLSQGIEINRRPVDAIFRKLTPTKISITIHEGRNRIVRKLMEFLNHEVKLLKRTKIGNLSLGNLKPGMYKELSQEDIKKIYETRRVWKVCSN